MNGVSGKSRSEGRPPDRRRATGREAEEAAARHLLDRGYDLVERNWRCRAGEIDLIANDGSVLVFVEVRSRRNPSRYGTAVEAVTPRKQAQVRSVAQIYLSVRKVTACPIRFDVVAITFDGQGAVSELRHLEGAF